MCHVDADGYLTSVTETHGLVRDGVGAAVERDGMRVPIDPNSIVSMNMWALTPDLIDALHEGFPKFLSSLHEDDLKAEYLLPTIIDGMVRDGSARVRVIPPSARWFGVTYREDKEAVVSAFKGLYDAGVYSADLYSK